jgi:hypothetical protein
MKTTEQWPVNEWNTPVPTPLVYSDSQQRRSRLFAEQPSESKPKEPSGDENLTEPNPSTIS